MQLLSALLFCPTAHAAVAGILRGVDTTIAQPAFTIKVGESVATSTTSEAQTLPSPSSTPSLFASVTLAHNSTTSGATSTITTASSADAADLNAQRKACEPSSVCVDKMTCGHRFGACYDKKHCDGNLTPYSVPLC